MKQIVCPEIVELQALMFAHRLKRKDVLAKAQVHRSSWHRWSHGGDVRNSSIRAIKDAIAAMISEKEKARV